MTIKINKIIPIPYNINYNNKKEYLIIKIV